jgi:hypothetical protein
MVGNKKIFIDVTLSASGEGQGIRKNYPKTSN